MTTKTDRQQIPMVETSVEAVVATKTFKLGIKHVLNGVVNFDAFDDDDFWGYDRGRLTAVYALTHSLPIPITDRTAIMQLALEAFDDGAWT